MTSAPLLMCSCLVRNYKVSKSVPFPQDKAQLLWNCQTEHRQWWIQPHSHYWTKDFFFLIAMSFSGTFQFGEIFYVTRRLSGLFSLVYYDFTKKSAICIHLKHTPNPLQSILSPQQSLEASGVSASITWSLANPSTWQSLRCHLVTSWWASPKLMPATNSYTP